MFLARKTAVKQVITAGFALFSMFFGSGNLIFPLTIGVYSQSAFSWAFLGLLLTGIFVPFLGLMSVIVSTTRGDQGKDYFSSLGRIPAFLLVLAMLSLMGPFGVGPRCLQIAAGGVAMLVPSLPVSFLMLVIALVVIVLLSVREGLIEVLGKRLSPALLVCLGIIFLAGLLSPQQVAISSHSPTEAFKEGLVQGYQTMDLLAAFFFASTALTYLRGKIADEKLIAYTTYAGVVGGLLLALSYLGFIYLGALYSSALLEISPEKRLLLLAQLVLGDAASPIAAALISLACITTLCVLVTLFADFLRAVILRNRIAPRLSIVITVALTVIVAQVGFFQLAAFIAASLAILYPALIVFAGVRLLRIAGYWQRIPERPLFLSAVVACVLAYVMQ